MPPAAGAARPSVRRSRVAALPGLVLAGALLAGCGADSSAATAPGGSAGGRVAVVAVENVWGDIARQVGGEHVEVTSVLTDPSADPHSYETDPRDAAAISSARFVIENGLGYDDFADKLLEATKDSGREVVRISDVVDAGADDPNPHLWYSPTYVPAAARAIAQQLGETDPAHAGDFQANLATFLTAYQPYVDTLATIRAKYGGQRVAYTERVPGYLLHAAGLTLGVPASFPQSLEDGDDPSPADVDAVDRALSGRTVRALLYNSQVSSDVTERVKDLAEAGGVPVVGVTETIPRGDKDFQTWQTDQARAVLAALGG